MSAPPQWKTLQDRHEAAPPNVRHGPAPVARVQLRPAPANLTAAVVGACRRERTVFADLKGRVFDSADCQTLLPPLIEQQRRGEFRLSLRCTVDALLTETEIALLYQAGVDRVRVEVDSLIDRTIRFLGRPGRAIHRIEGLSRVVEAGFAVDWALRLGLPGERDEDHAELAAMLPAIFHLPPPALSWERADAPHGIAEAISVWRDQYRRDLLTYSRGPDFVRIADRRGHPVANSGKEDLITLAATQASIFLSCHKPQRLDAILGEFDGSVSEDGARGFLELLARRRVVYASPEGDYLALPLRCNLAGPR